MGHPISVFPVHSSWHCIYVFCACVFSEEVFEFTSSVLQPQNGVLRCGGMDTCPSLGTRGGVLEVTVGARFPRQCWSEGCKAIELAHS